MHKIPRILITITFIAGLGGGTLVASASPSGGGPDEGALPTAPQRSAARSLAVPAAPRVIPAPEAVPSPAPPTPAAPRLAPETRTHAVDENGSKFSAADPSIERDGDRWLLLTTQAGWFNVPMWESTDMVNWSSLGDALPVLPDWAGGKTWAPDAIEIDGQWILFFSSLWGDTELHCIGHAVAATSAGPYQAADEPIVCPLAEGGAIDPMVHIDSDGNPHLLWKVDGNAIGRASVLRSQALSPDGTALQGESAMLLRYQGGWEWPLIEQPELIEFDGQLHLFYAAGWYNTANYQVGHAICESVAGPCERTSTDGGWLTTVGSVEGPGAISIAEAGGGLVGVYHAWIDGVRPAAGEFRSLVVEPLELVDGQPQRVGDPVGD